MINSLWDRPYLEIILKDHWRVHDFLPLGISTVEYGPDGQNVGLFYPTMSRLGDTAWFNRGNLEMTLKDHERSNVTKTHKLIARGPKYKVVFEINLGIIYTTLKGGEGQIWRRISKSPHMTSYLCFTVITIGAFAPLMSKKPLKYEWPWISPWKVIKVKSDWWHIQKAHIYDFLFVLIVTRPS
jgi:hypothetical protein